MAKSKFLKVDPGDILAIPTKKQGKLGYVLARVIERKQSALIEVFEEFYDNFNVDKEVLAHRALSKSNRLFLPIKVALLFEDSKGADKWKILSHSENFDEEIAKNGIVFTHPDYQELGIYWENGVEKRDPPEDRNRDKIAEDTTIYQTAQVVLRVQLYMDGVYNKNDIYDSVTELGKFYKIGVLSQLLDEAVKTSIAVAKEFEKKNDLNIVF